MAAKRKAKKPGPPRKEIDTRLLRALAAIGANLDEISAAMAADGCKLSVLTLKRRLQEPEYRDIWEAGRSKFKVSLRRLQARHAKMASSAGVQMTIHMSKHHLGESEKSLIEVSGKNGGPLQMVDLSKATDEQLATLESFFGPLAARELDDDDNSGGTSSPATPA